MLAIVCWIEPRLSHSPGHFFVETDAGSAVFGGRRDRQHHLWKPARLTVTDSSGRRHADLGEVRALLSLFRNLLADEGVENVGLSGYVRDHGRCPRWIGPPLSRLSAWLGQGD